MQFDNSSRTKGGSLGRGRQAGKYQRTEITPSEASALSRRMEIIGGVIQDVFEEIDRLRTEAKKRKRFLPSIMGYVDNLARLMQLKVEIESQLTRIAIESEQSMSKKAFIDKVLETDPEAVAAVKKLHKIQMEYLRSELEKSDRHGEG
jgi:hypothetical protein